MNKIFEAVVERAVRETASKIDDSWTVDGQANIGNIIDGPHAVDMTPDFAVRDGEETIPVGDAKWKAGGTASNDVYQVTAYMLADSTPGLLVYPEQDGLPAPSTVRAKDTHLSLESVTLPTTIDAPRYEDFIAALQRAVEQWLESSTLQQR